MSGLTQRWLAVTGLVVYVRMLDFRRIALKKNFRITRFKFTKDEAWELAEELEESWKGQKSARQIYDEMCAGGTSWLGTELKVTQ